VEHENYSAVYRDQQGRTYSCPVVKNDGAWAMVTSDGPQPITPEFQDDAAGTLTFVEYRAEPDFRLHVEPGGDSFRVLQEAGAKATTHYRNTREGARQHALQTMNEPDPQKVRREESLRETKKEFGRQMRPRGGGEFIIKNRDE